MSDLKVTPGVQYLHERIRAADQAVAVLLEQAEVQAAWRARVEKVLTSKQRAALDKAP